ncbi:hypothetical protein BGZ51_002737 [Haplosporangium sp. Z 767]|nr:hypothetical protein BGZ51_002737 [Haplosporangium sp. Z 767]
MAEFDIQQLVLVSDATNDAENLEHLGPTMKEVYRNNKMKPFLDQLSQFIRRKEVEIEKMCNSNYQEFVHSVDRLLKVRQGTVDLKDKIHTLNTDVQQAGTELTAKKRELIESKRILENIATATETLRTCIHFLDLANRVNVQVENRKYYSALRIVDEIQVVHLRSVIQFEFARHMQDCIPILQHAIKDAVTTEMKEWLFSIRASQKDMGKLAMDRMAARQQRWRERFNKGIKLKASHNVNSAVEEAVNEENEVDIMDAEQFKLDFKPLYQCLHIYDELGQRTEFRTNYAEDRRAQAKLTLSSITSSFNLKDRNTDNFEALLQDIVGFFIVEHIILYSTINFRTQSQLDELCELVTSLLLRLLSEGLANCQDPDMFLNVKLLLMIYIQTMESYNYPVSKLNDLLLTLFRTYADQLETKFSANFHKVVPYCCEDIKQFVGQFYRFVEGFNQEQNEMDDLVKDSLDTLLIQHVHSVWLKKLESRNLSQIAQIIINLEYFQGACGDFEQLLADSRSTSDTTKISLQATGLFRETRKNAEKRISELVNSKIDDILELAEYDWLPTGIQELHSTYLQELVSFLSIVMSATLQNLPDSIKTFVYYDALEHLASMLHGIFTDSNVKHINQNFVAVFDKDIRYLEDFVATLDNPNVAETFLPLRQLITLLLSENTEDYMDPQIRSRHYSQVKPEDVTRMLEKLMTAPVAATTTQERTKRRSWGKVLEWGALCFMYPNQANRNLDKENDIVAEAAAARGGTGVPNASQVKQASSLMGSRTPTTNKQQQLMGPKSNLTKTPLQQGRTLASVLNSPSTQNALRTKTNFQQLPPAADDIVGVAKKKGDLARTFSATFENIMPSTPVTAESRRRSLTKRGSTKTRLVVHKDEPATKETVNSNLNQVKDDSYHKSKSKPAVTTRPAKAAPLETTTTLLSIQRAVESEDKVVVGSADIKTKRRALTNDEDKLEIEYCPPPIEEQPYDPGFKIDHSVLATVPPALAYHTRSMKEFAVDFPELEPAEYRRSPPVVEPVKVAENTLVPTTRITADGHFEAIWRDEENDHQVHPKGGCQFGIKDLDDESKTEPPFDGFLFDVDGSEDSLSEDEDDIHGGCKAAKKDRTNDPTEKDVSEFNEAIGLEDLEDESKVEAPFTDFSFEV